MLEIRKQTDRKIAGFFKEYQWLSNFWPCRIVYEGLEYLSVEHAYQAQKTDDKATKIKISNTTKAADAKRYMRGRNERGAEWDAVKVEIMKELVRLKFQTPALGKELLATGDAYLEEANYWKDTFWGTYYGQGENWLGKILMEIREELRLLPLPSA